MEPHGRRFGLSRIAGRARTVTGDTTATHMKGHIKLLVLLIFSCVALCQWVQASQPPVIKCNVGPIAKQYGHAAWLVYSCDDAMSVVVVAEKNNPAAPFYFFFAHSDKGYEMHGEGTGDKRLTDAAFAQLRTLSDSQIMSLVRETRKASRGSQAQ
jgi:hypothetical protein